MTGPAYGRGLLPPRQRSVLVLVAQGYSNAEIAHQLHISAATVKTHMKAICERLGARNRAHCVHLAHRLGLAEVATAAPDALETVARPRSARQAPQFEKVGMTFRVVRPCAAPAIPVTQRAVAVTG